MSATSKVVVPDEAERGPGILGLLLAMAMFVLVVDTSLMNVSISAVVKDLGTTASGVQSAIALEALVSRRVHPDQQRKSPTSSAASSLCPGSARLCGRRAGHGPGADAAAVIIFWAIFGGLGASLLLPSMQALIHGNFQGVAQKKVYALVGASAAIAAAIGPLIGGFVTTFLSWRVGFLAEIVVIALVLSGIRLVKDVPYTGDRHIDFVGARAVRLRHGRHRARHPRLGGGRRSGRCCSWPSVPSSFAALAWWLVRRKRQGAAADRSRTCSAPSISGSGISGQTLQQIALGGSMIALPIFFQMVLEYNALQAGIALTPLSISMFLVAILAGRRSGTMRRRPATIIQIGFVLVAAGTLAMIPFVPRIDSGLWLAPSLIVMGIGLGLLVSQLNNYTLAPISEERISEAAGVNSAGGLVWAVVRPRARRRLMLGALAFRFTSLANESTVLSDPQKHPGATTLNENAEVMSNTTSGRAARDRAAGGSGRGHSHQHRGAPVRAPGRTARAALLGPARAGRLDGDDAPEGRPAVGQPRGVRPGGIGGRLRA